jgi:hypothetical protein
VAPLFIVPITEQRKGRLTVNIFIDFVYLNQTDSFLLTALSVGVKVNLVDSF